MSPTDKKDDPEDGTQFDRGSLLDIEIDSVWLMRLDCAFASIKRANFLSISVNGSASILAITLSPSLSRSSTTETTVAASRAMLSSHRGDLPSSRIFQVARRRLVRLGPRWFVLRDVHTDEGPVLLQPRWALSWLRGSMTRTELQQALRRRREVGG